ncbi:uroporphyrinogen-III synthase [Pseudooctadecabacter jejudonensis]|uniref:Uroporphyrinogen-III synthase n=1 Tax=Pseudooctadecabacter jejudonensis TaxID=1391910 RepID=A0A1Y5S5Q5_9RHOB|nr:uroporphyrinogen-III synthase [Pseudooctadecabacter jejudonensis]SLN33125.1 uroporphyrinogen-III synthase [Pseudooctadecabacter jejudonensis]
MVRFDNPIVLVTRPRAASEAFVEGLRQHAGAFEPVIAPVFEIGEVARSVPCFDEAIFTSKAGVAFAPEGEGRIAWCVGDATAQAARAAGYEARSAAGDADTLIDLILTEQTGGRLVHLRGEISRGDVSQRLTAAGVTCAEVVNYRKIACPPPAELGGLLRAHRNIIFPAFSAETVSLFLDWPLEPKGMHIVAISAAVAQAAEQMSPQNITVADRPDLASMTQAVAALIA